MLKKSPPTIEWYKKVISFLIVHLCIITGGAISMIFRLNYLYSTILILVPPAIYLLYQLKKIQNKIIAQTLLFYLPIIVITDVLAHYNHAWIESTMFPYRVLGLFPFETFVWGIFYGIFMISFYEYFFDTKKQKKFNPNFKYAVAIIWIVLIMLVIIRINTPWLLTVRYFYTIYIGMFILLNAYTYIKYRGFASKALIAGLLLVPVSLCDELVQLSLNHWYFPLQTNLLYVWIAGHPIPVEELLWFTVIPMAAISVYEVFADNHRA